MSSDTIRLLHTSDWHLGAPDSKWPGGQASGAKWVERLRACRESAVSSIVTLAISKRVNAVLVAGDVLDQPALPENVKKRCEQFLLEKVVKPLWLHHIPLVLTPGSHDWFRARPGRDSSLRLLRALAEEHADSVKLLMPPGLYGQKCFDVEYLRIATEPPTRSWRGQWVEFLHHDQDSQGGRRPLYCAYGDKHILWLDKKRQKYYPGSPLARTTAADGAGAGPRHTLLVSLAQSGTATTEPMRLPALETAVLRRSGDVWLLIYDRDYERHRWKVTVLSGSVDQALLKVRRDRREVGWVTLVATGSYQQILPPIEAFADAIRGRRPHLLSVWLQEPPTVPQDADAARSQRIELAQ